MIDLTRQRMQLILSFWIDLWQPLQKSSDFSNQLSQRMATHLFFFFFKGLRGPNYHCVCVKSLSRVRLFPTPWTVARHAPLSMGFSKQEYWSGLPFPSPGDLPNPGIKSGSSALQADALSSEPPRKPEDQKYPDPLETTATTLLVVSTERMARKAK